MSTNSGNLDVVFNKLVKNQLYENYYSPIPFAANVS